MGLKEKLDALREEKAEEYVTEMGFSEEHKEYFKGIFETAFNIGVLSFLEVEKEYKL